MVGDNDTALLEIQKKQLFFSRITAIFVGLIFVAISVSLCVLVPSVDGVMDRMNAVLGEMDSSMDRLDKMSESVTQISDSLGVLFGENGESFTESIKKLSEIDVDSMNKAIGDLKSTMETLSEALKRLSSFSLFG